MKRALAAVVVVAALAVPAVAQAVDRQIATKPDTSGQANGYLRAWRFNPTVDWQTWVSACCYVPSLNKPWYSVGRPTSDLYAADRAAAHFWPGCSRVWYGSNSQNGYYYTFYHVSC